MFLLMLLCPTQAPDLPGDIFLATQTTAMARQWQHVYVNMFVQAAKEKMTGGETLVVVGNGFSVWGRLMTVVACSGVRLLGSSPCGCKAGRREA
jgi:hypothetical protein